MGDIAEMMLEGSMCQYCGEILDMRGYPTICPACQIENGVDEFGNKKPRKVKCPDCGKTVKEAGLYQHMEAKHGDRHV